MSGPNLVGESFSSLTLELLYAGLVSSTSETTIYSVPVESSVKIASATFCNNAAVSVNLSVSLVPAGDTAGAENRIVSAFAIPGGETLSLADYLSGAMISDGDFLSVEVSASDAVSVVLTGAVLS